MTQPLLKVIINTNTSRVQIQNPPKKQQQPQKENEILERIKAVEEEVGLEASDDKDTVHLRLREIELKDFQKQIDMINDRISKIEEKLKLMNTEEEESDGYD